MSFSKDGLIEQLEYDGYTNDQAAEFDTSQGGHSLKGSEGFRMDVAENYYLVKISSKNEHSIHVFEKLGAVFDGEEESPFKRFMETFKSVMNDEIGDSFKKYFETGDDPGEEIIYRYKLFPKQIRTK